MVKVYSFRRYKLKTDEYEYSKCKATQGFIRQNSCEKLDETEEDVLPELLRSDGRVRTES